MRVLTLAIYLTASLLGQGQTNTVYMVPPLIPNNGAGGVTFEAESA